MIVQATHFLMGVLLVMADTTSLTFLEQGWMSQAFNKDIENISSTSNCRLEPGCVCLSVHVSVWSAISGECLFLSYLQIDYTLKLWPLVAVLLLDSA